MRNPGMMRLGMFATATFRGQKKETYTVVPASAILHIHDRDWVYVPAPGPKFRRVEVVSGDALPNNMQEVKSGLKPGQQVVANALVLEHTIETIRETRHEDDSRPRRFCAQQPVCGAGARDPGARLGSDLVSQPARRGLSRHRGQLRHHHHAMAGQGRRGGRTTSHDSDRNPDERNSASLASSIGIDLRSVLRPADLRRQLEQRLEPAEGHGADGSGRFAAGPSALHGHRLEYDRTDLLVRAEEHQSAD